jgi:hypothetical protein
VTLCCLLQVTQQHPRRPGDSVGAGQPAAVGHQLQVHHCVRAAALPSLARQLTFLSAGNEHMQQNDSYSRACQPVLKPYTSHWHHVSLYTGMCLQAPADLALHSQQRLPLRRSSCSKTLCFWTLGRNSCKNLAAMHRQLSTSSSATVMLGCSSCQPVDVAHPSAATARHHGQPALCSRPNTTHCTA